MGIPSRRVGVGSVVIAVVLLATVAMPVGAWSRWFKVNDGSATSGWADNDVTATEGDRYHAAFDSVDLGGGWLVYTRRDVSDDAIIRRVLGYTCDLAQGIAVEGDTVLIACSHLSDGELQVYRSGDGGETWAGPVKVGTGAWSSENSSITISQGVALVAWTDGRGRIKVKRSTNGGETFGPAVQLGTTTARGLEDGKSGRVKIDAHGSHVYVVWTTKRETHPTYATRGLTLRRSTNLGATWGSSRTLTDGKLLDMGPAVAATASGVLIAYSTAGFDLRLLRSTDKGASFTTRVLTGSSEDLVDIAVAGDKVVVAWATSVSKYNLGVRIRRSSDGGRTWAGTQNTGVTFGPDSSPWANVNLLEGTPIISAAGKDRTSSNWLGYSMYVSRP